MMLTKRQFFSIFLVFLAAFLLFQGSQIGKMHWSDYKVNSFDHEITLTRDNMWSPDGGTTFFKPYSFLYIGDEDSPLAVPAAQWAAEIGGHLSFFAEIPDNLEETPEMILVEKDYLRAVRKTLPALVEKGTTAVLLNLPDAESVGSSGHISGIVGITSVLSLDCEVQDARITAAELTDKTDLFTPNRLAGFSRQQASAPWYVVDEDATILMQGTASKDAKLVNLSAPVIDPDTGLPIEFDVPPDAETAAKVLERRSLPLMWRHDMGEGRVYSINGSYMEVPDLCRTLLAAIGEDVLPERQTIRKAAPTIEELPVLYVGDESSDYALVAKKWAAEAVCALTFTDTLPETVGEDEPTVILVEKAYLHSVRKTLPVLLEQGAVAVLLNLPSPEEVAGSAHVSEIAGITSALSLGAPLDESLSCAKVTGTAGSEQTEEKDFLERIQLKMMRRQNASAPWYVVTKDSEVLIEGSAATDAPLVRLSAPVVDPATGLPVEFDVPPDEEAAAMVLESRSLPLVWRHDLGAGKVYSVNGNYLRNPAFGPELLGAICSQILPERDDTGIPAGSTFNPANCTVDGVIPDKDFGPWVLYVGSRTSASANSARQWALYAKRKIAFTESLPPSLPGEKPQLILVEGSSIQSVRDKLLRLLDEGVDVVCMDLPDPLTINNSEALKELLGIYVVWNDRIDLHGLRFFQGFFLGGERIYEVDDDAEEEERKKQDLPLTYPWYIARRAAKVYVQGILSEEEADTAEEMGLKNEDLPAIIWRNACRNGMVYVINGSFMDDVKIGTGLLSAIAGQTEKYYIYPVVNAQTYSFLNFPENADENDGVIRPNYGHSPTDLQKNIILPSIASLLTRNSYEGTFFFTPQLDYSDMTEPTESIFEEYLKTLNETQAEMGFSLSQHSEVPLQDKLKRDTDYLDRAKSEFRFSSLNGVNLNKAKIAEALDHELFSSGRTVLYNPGEKYPFIGFLNDKVTFQQPTSDAKEHTFMEDLRLLGTETALGYSSMYYDMAQVLWPMVDDDEWQYMSQKVFSNMTTYMLPFSKLSSVTVSESDDRIRRFLSLGYDTKVLPDGTIAIIIDEFEQNAYFIVRCFDQEVTHVEGGSFVKLEDGAWLISADVQHIYVKLTPTEKNYYR